MRQTTMNWIGTNLRKKHRRGSYYYFSFLSLSLIKFSPHEGTVQNEPHHHEVSSNMRKSDYDTTGIEFAIPMFGKSKKFSEIQSATTRIGNVASNNKNKLIYMLWIQISRNDFIALLKGSHET